MEDVFNLSSYDYPLPQDLIAYYPVKDKGSSRMLVLKKEEDKFEERHVTDLPSLVDRDTIIVFNNTKVMPARLIGKKLPSGGKVDCVLLEQVRKEKDWFVWSALIKGRKLSVGQRLNFGKGVEGVFLGRGKIGFEFDIKTRMNDIGYMPLPPYIKRPPEDKDRETYQTVIAKEEGSVAAPTAGLHFTEEMIAKMKDKADKLIEVTLHVGYGTFAPVKVTDIRKHRMHSEYFSAYKTDIDYILKMRGKKKILAIGTTSVRVLESIAISLEDHKSVFLKEGRYFGYTDIFIYPGYEFKIVDCLFTNFHMPKSTLLMLVCAFAGRDKILRAYRYAVDRKYRFFSYGDAMLIC